MAYRKPHLPVKTCKRCGLPFSWRKKWERHWSDVIYCSNSCRKGKKVPRNE